MFTFNQVVLRGRLGQDPRIVSNNNAEVANLSIATHRRFRQNETWMERTDWLDVVVFQASLVKNLKKGDFVTIIGHLISVQDSSNNFNRMKIVADRVIYDPVPKKDNGDNEDTTEDLPPEADFDIEI